MIKARTSLCPRTCFDPLGEARMDSEQASEFLSNFDGWNKGFCLHCGPVEPDSETGLCPCGASCSGVGLSRLREAMRLKIKSVKAQGDIALNRMNEMKENTRGILDTLMKMESTQNQILLDQLVSHHYGEPPFLQVWRSHLKARELLVEKGLLPSPDKVQ